ncbi:permease for cytosine/purines, uracil, thiamine, allantoin-domain-containing protein [Truncatella angustata]|uniref:Permease for cytosine/purines, uracil, thiamine, allantoin-domain-containing protein n=1 Tax=Truncatella angustata TaxID=152316 RepID=A0A9P8ZUB7_9PEZI|nr:permease for cytosine/purines, uracil, thiamine, allantoin-domain-containing protein [Truncatella angustata]KAH6648198.1 permease for cytosine/purines, uracil, thiamine, allantoin-domain-containing protein [Truncatella angustata]
MSTLPQPNRARNNNIGPLEVERRTGNFLTFHNSWLLCNCSIAAYLTGSALIPLGLTWWQAIICKNVITTAALLVSSLAGAYYNTRVGGQYVYLILHSWDPDLEQNVMNTIPSDTGMTSAQFIAYVIFCVSTIPFLWIHSHRIRKLLNGFGATLGSDIWLMISGIIKTIGSIAAGIINQNDFARYASRPAHAYWGQAFAFPIYSIFASVLDILVTAATQNRLGERLRLERDGGGAGTRATVAFAGLALTIAQMGTNIPGNAFAGGIDLSTIFPLYINVRRAAYITAILCPIVYPWRLVKTATTFLTVLSGYGVFLAPMTGMMAASYLIVNKQKLQPEHLYRGDAISIYWYNKGVNWRAPVAWLVGIAMCLPGFIAAVDTSITVPNSVAEFYDLNCVYGFLSGALCYIILHGVFPASAVDAFANQSPEAKEMHRLHHIRWDTAFEFVFGSVWPASRMPRYRERNDKIVICINPSAVIW